MRHIVSSIYWPISLEDWLCLSWKSTFNFMDPSVSKLNFGRLLHWAMLLGRPDNASYALRRSKGDKVARRITHESLGWSKNCFRVGKIIKWSRSRAPYHIILQNQKLSSKSVIITKSHHSSTTFTMSTMISSICGLLLLVFHTSCVANLEIFAGIGIWFPYLRIAYLREGGIRTLKRTGDNIVRHLIGEGIAKSKWYISIRIRGVRGSGFVLSF